MSSNLIASTSKSTMHALAFKGIMVYASFAQIRDMLLRKFGDEYVLLFARPAENRGDGFIDWYTPVQGTARHLADLSPQERAPVCEHIEHMANSIADYADELIDSNEPLKVTRGNILKLALSYPDESAIYVIGGQPVFTCWGFGPGTPGVEAKTLTRMAMPVSQKASAVAQSAEPAVNTPAPAISAPSPSPSSNPVRSGGICFWGWLMALLPLALLFLLLFGAFGPLAPLSGVALFSFPSLPFMPQRADHSLAISALEAELVSLRAKIEKQAALCVPEKPVAPKKSEAAAAQKPLVIPEEAHDTTFLEGSWICETGLASRLTGEPVQFSFSFDRSGQGHGVVMEKNDRCSGTAKAQMRDGVLHISLGQQKCANSGNSYDSVSIECQNSRGSAAKCRGTNADGSTWNGIFLRY